MSSNVTEEMLIAYADGELDEINCRRVERALADDPLLAKQLAAHRKLRATLTAHYAPVVEEPVPDRFARLLNPDVIDIAQARTTKERRSAWRGWGSVTALAASLVLGLLVGRQLPGDTGPIAIRSGAMVAQGELAKALDTQLASAQDVASTVRIGLTFRAKDGGWCRSFDGTALSGVACRRGQTWQVQQALPGTESTAAYRQASSGDPRMMATIDILMADSPVDAAGEKSAREQGWR